MRSEDAGESETLEGCVVCWETKDETYGPSFLCAFAGALAGRHFRWSFTPISQTL